MNFYCFFHCWQCLFWSKTKIPLKWDPFRRCHSAIFSLIYKESGNNNITTGPNDTDTFRLHFFVCQQLKATIETHWLGDAVDTFRIKKNSFSNAENSPENKWTWWVVNSFCDKHQYERNQKSFLRLCCSSAVCCYIKMHSIGNFSELYAYERNEREINKAIKTIFSNRKIKISFIRRLEYKFLIQEKADEMMNGLWCGQEIITYYRLKLAKPNMKMCYCNICFYCSLLVSNPNNTSNAVLWWITRNHMRYDQLTCIVYGLLKTRLFFVLNGFYEENLTISKKNIILFLYFFNPNVLIHLEI